MFMCEQSGKKTVWKQLRQNQISPETEKTNVFRQLSEETNWRGNVFTINYFFQLWAKKKRTGEQYVYAWNWGETIILFILYSKYKKLKVLICKKKKVNNKMWWVKKKGRVKTDERNIWGENLFYFTREIVKKVEEGKDVKVWKQRGFSPGENKRVNWEKMSWGKWNVKKKFMIKKWFCSNVWKLSGNKIRKCFSVFYFLCLWERKTKLIKQKDWKWRGVILSYGLGL